MSNENGEQNAQVDESGQLIEVSMDDYVAWDLKLTILFLQWQSNWHETIDSFDRMELRDELLRGIYSYGFEKPSAIQQRAIKPCIMSKWDYGALVSCMMMTSCVQILTS